MRCESKSLVPVTLTLTIPSHPGDDISSMSFKDFSAFALPLGESILDAVRPADWSKGISIYIMTSTNRMSYISHVLAVVTVTLHET